jgi:hypothetical protein
VHLRFGEDQAAADLVMRGVRLLEQMLGLGAMLRSVHLPPPVPGFPVLESYRGGRPANSPRVRYEVRRTQMEALTPASADDLPPLGELIVDDPFWRYPSAMAGEGAAHLRVWLTAGAQPGHLAVVAETGGGASVTESARRIQAELAGRYRPSLVLLEHHLAPEFGEGAETLDLVRIGADGSPHWSRV